ncbi:MAG TPA: branched-chain amino acid ABC transporter permease [Solirubrobacteraceae bacterium]|jgi:branched-chain amino acid transport system permease protein|nr:branched-chain amino acid ABC transporter permease [Solirubrobacteraceae bacterium]
MPSWTQLQPFIVTGLSLGGVYALSGTGIVVLYRTTGVLNLAFGAIGMFGAFLSWQLIHEEGWPQGLGFLAAVAFSVVAMWLYGMVFGPPLAQRDPLVKASATLGFALILLGASSWIWSAAGGATRFQPIPTDTHHFSVGEAMVNWTQVIALAVGVLVVVLTGALLRFTRLGTAMRALANDREVSAVLGVPVRRVEAVAWLWAGVLSGVSGLLLSDLVGLDQVTLTFIVLISSVAAALIARLRSILGTLVAGLGIGLVDACAQPFSGISRYHDMAPFVLALVGLLFVTRKGGALAGRRIV